MMKILDDSELSIVKNKLHCVRMRLKFMHESYDIIDIYQILKNHDCFDTDSYEYTAQDDEIYAILDDIFNSIRMNNNQCHVSISNVYMNYMKEKK
jgi:hypothetical protein